MSINSISGSMPMPLQSTLAPSRTDIDGVLAQIRAMRSQTPLVGTSATGIADVPGSPGAVTPGVGFGQQLKVALDNVNALQKDSGEKAEAFAAGRSDDLVGTMLAMQKSNVAFQATVQVRNRLVSAYQDIMNMPI
jgi:flagellar hook-basal body complex protein FliE